MFFEIGKIYNRKRDIHDRFRGSRQSGITASTSSPIVFLFTGEAGHQYGYRDGWNYDGVFLYTGDGQVGDMTFIRGNKTILEHSKKGKDLLLFESLGKGKGYRFLGDFVCSGWEERRGLDRNGAERKIIVFHLTSLADNEIPDSESKLRIPSSEASSIGDLRTKALAASQVAAKQSPKESLRSYYERSEAIRTYVLCRAKGKCESCGNSAPFTRQDGSPYLEPHHIRRVSDGGPDHPRWVAAVCPNCHREAHYGVSKQKLNKRLEAHLGNIEESLDARLSSI